MRATASVSVRPNRRIWVSVNGKIITLHTPAAQPDPAHKAHWTAYVIEASTGQQVEAYPHLTGEDAVSTDPKEAERDVKRIYLDRCRFTDTQVDVETLKGNYATQVWDIHVEITDPAPQAANH